MAETQAHRALPALHRVPAEGGRESQTPRSVGPSIHAPRASLDKSDRVPCFSLSWPSSRRRSSHSKAAPSAAASLCRAKNRHRKRWPGAPWEKRCQVSQEAIERFFEIDSLPRRAFVEGRPRAWCRADHLPPAQLRWRSRTPAGAPCMTVLSALLRAGRRQTRPRRSPVALAGARVSGVLALERVELLGHAGDPLRRGNRSAIWRQKT
jgi:hypothetical protein